MSKNSLTGPQIYIYISYLSETLKAVLTLASMAWQRVYCVETRKLLSSLRFVGGFINGLSTVSACRLFIQ